MRSWFNMNTTLEPSATNVIMDGGLADHGGGGYQGGWWPHPPFANSVQFFGGMTEISMPVRG